MNGFFTFGWSTPEYLPRSFPASGNYIAIYMSNVGIICGSSRRTGDVYYRVANGEYILVQMNI